MAGPVRTRGSAGRGAVLRAFLFRHAGAQYRHGSVRQAVFRAIGCIRRPFVALTFLGLAVGGALLVRPDKHVAWRSLDVVEDPAAALRTALRQVLGRAS